MGRPFKDGASQKTCLIAKIDTKLPGIEGCVTYSKVFNTILLAVLCVRETRCFILFGKK